MGNNAAPGTIRPPGFATPLAVGKAYTGRVVRASGPGAKVDISLSWGAGSEDRQTVSLNALIADYTK